MHSKEQQVSLDVQNALNANTELKQALQDSDMPIRFQAMVLGLTTLRQMNPERDRSKTLLPGQRPD